MAKYEEPFPDTQNNFSKFITEADLERFVNIKILTVNTLKEIGKVVKANDLVAHMTGEDVIILLNESVYEHLTDIQKEIVIKDLLARINFDAEKDKLSIVVPDFQGFSLILDKYQYPVVKALDTTIKTIFQAQKEEEDARKNAKTSTKKPQHA